MAAAFLFLAGACAKKSATTSSSDVPSAPANSAPASAGASQVADQAPAPGKARTGQEIYDTYCAVCHMADGSGVPNFQPPLRGSPIVAGDPAKLEAVVRAGSAALADRPSSYEAEMPPFGSLSDEEVHAVVAYVRERFAKPAGGVSRP